MSTDLDPRDATLQAHVPAVMVPRFANFPDLEENGHRYLVAQDGLWLEVRRPWLHLRWPMAESPAPLPYGPVISDEMAFAFELEGINFEQIVDMLTLDARKAMPNECAAWGVWDTREERLVYRPLIATNATTSGVRFHRARLESHEHLAIDLHSHGAMQPFFSSTDDADDAGEVKLSLVMGGAGTDHEHTVMRLCAHGLFIPFEDAPE